MGTQREGLSPFAIWRWTLRVGLEQMKEELGLEDELSGEADTATPKNIQVLSQCVQTSRR